MPGAGGIKAATYIESIAPQDGTAWGFITRGFMLGAAAEDAAGEFQSRQVQLDRQPARTVSMGMVWNASTDVRTIQDAMQKEVVVGATTIAQDTGIFPRALNRIAGTKFKIVTGYAGLGAVDLALERGEVQGKVGSTWKSLNSGPSANWVRDKVVTVLVQLGVKKAPDIPADIPLGLDLAKSPEDRQVLEVLCAPSATGYPSFMGPGVPKDRVEAIRSAYQQTLKDPGIHRGDPEAGPRPRSDRGGRAGRHRARHLCAAGGRGRTCARPVARAIVAAASRRPPSLSRITRRSTPTP